MRWPIGVRMEKAFGKTRMEQCNWVIAGFLLLTLVTMLLSQCILLFQPEKIAIIIPSFTTGKYITMLRLGKPSKKKVMSFARNQTLKSYLQPLTFGTVSA